MYIKRITFSLIPLCLSAAAIYVPRVVAAGSGAIAPETTLFHYDVVVTGHAQSAHTQTGISNETGTRTITVDWTTTFKNAELTRVGTGAEFVVVKDRVFTDQEVKGTTDVTYTFDYAFEQLATAAYSPCQGVIQLSTLGSHLLLSGAAGYNGRNTFEFSSLLDESAGSQLDATVQNRTDDACNKQPFLEWPAWNETETVAVVRGLTINYEVPRSLLELRATRDDPIGLLLSPLKELAIGDAFSFTTGEVRLSFSCGDDCNVTTMTELKVSVTPHQLSKCAERQGPIPEGDSVITHEDINIDISTPVVTPDGDGHAYVTIRVTCDQVPIEKAPVEVNLDVVPNSGYHQHGPDRPRGQLDGQEMKKDSILTLYTDADGYAYAPASKTKSIKFEPPPLKKSSYGTYLIGIAGTYEVTAKTTSKKVPESSGTEAITAKVSGLVPMDSAAGGRYTIGGGDGGHKSGSSGKTATIDAFKNLANDVQKYQQLHNLALAGCGNKTPWTVSPVGFNDIALPDGGLFDIDANWKIGPRGHQSHNTGDGGDFNRFEAGPTSNQLALGKGTECDGSVVKITPWLVHLLLDLGEKYGRWDCKDMGGCAGGANNPYGDSYPAMPGKLHLHVGDARQ